MSLFIFKEINDPIFKESSLYKICRLIIRLLLNINLYSPIFIKLIKIISLKNKDIILLLDKNLFYFDYLNNLKRGNLSEILKIKYQWANYIIENNSMHAINSISLANNYISLLDDNDNKKNNEQVSSINKEITFYIYGPNSKFIPDINYNQATLILTKFPNFPINEFKNKILFLNSHTLNNTDPKTIKQRCHDFDSVLIPRGNNKLIRKMKYLPLFPQDNLASPMGLQRILYYLKTTQKVATLLIEGFDLGVYKNAYSGRIKTFYKKENFENEYRLSLISHDFIYNFLLIKNLVKSFKFYKSESFLE